MDFPPIGVRVLVSRKTGPEIIARRDFRPDAIFRDPHQPHWLDNEDKFIDVRINPVVSWKPIAVNEPAGATK